MKAIMVMFDTLSKNFLPNYGNQWVEAPNFQRLQERCATFDNFYGGSMPCMPARRELHTGKYNFLHRGWGPLEPFDTSVFADLSQQGIYTHLITDHSHYFEDGGATYHNRYSSWEGIRGQEGDRWQPRLKGEKDANQHPLNKQGLSRQQHLANRQQLHEEAEMPSVKVIDQGLRFLEEHHQQENWFLQLECFDPHEPFFVPEKYRELYHCRKATEVPYWPVYAPLAEVKATEADLLDLQKEYAALLSMCDYHLGRILDFMDHHELWQDTLLIVNTDHGFLLGEHGWLGKNAAPMYEEIVHIPFFIHAPASNSDGQRITALAQTIDLPATLRDYFGLVGNSGDGHSLLPLLTNEGVGHESVLFGINGGHVNIYDGRYTYMRASRYPDNGPLVNYTLMPTHMRGFFAREQLQTAQLTDGGKFTDYLPVLKVQLPNEKDSYSTGDLLFDLQEDPGETTQLVAETLHTQMAAKLEQRLRRLDVPPEEMQRLGFVERATGS